MKQVLPILKNRLLFHTSLWILLDSTLMSLSLFPEDDSEAKKSASPTFIQQNAPKEDVAQGYTINFNNVSINEFLRFISKVLSINFVFDETDVQFNVTIVSEEPVSRENILAILIQELRIHDLVLLEEGENNLVITKNKTVQQLATVVSTDLAGSEKTQAPMITRVFRIKNANVSSLAAIIKPMISAGALLETSVETRQLIITDIRTNIDKIAELLESLDAPHSTLEIDVYVAKNIPPRDIVNLSREILTPFTMGNTLILVPQTETNTIFIVSTSDLVERAINVMSDLDKPTKGPAILEQRHLEKLAAESTFFLYPLKHKKGNQVLANLNDIAKHLSESSYPNIDLLTAIHNVKWVEENNSLIISGTKATVDELKTMIANFDTAEAKPPEKTTFFIYKPTHKAPKEIEKSLQELARDLESSGLVDIDFLETVASAKHIPLTNSILFTGTPEGLQKLKEMLASLDVQGVETTQVQHVGHLTFLIYKLKYVTANQLMASLNSFAGDLQKSNSLDPELAQALGSMKWIKETNSILFSGTQESLERVENLVKRFDIAELKSQPAQPAGQHSVPLSFSIYKPHYKTGDELISILCDFEQHLINSGVKDPALFGTINNLKWVENTSSIIISGEKDSITKVEGLLQRFDTPEKSPTPSIEAFENTSFLVYKLQYHRGEEISSALKQVAAELSKNPSAANKSLADAINSIQWITITNSLLVTGEQDVLTKLRELISNLDVPLKQVFIEVLVIETTLTNTQAFGLQWGGKMNYLNKFAAGTGNFPAVDPTTGQGGLGSSLTPTFSNGLNTVNGATPPSSTMIPLSTSGGGFDLGIIGDIIMHKGKSFINLGSLVNALQTDQDTTILLNPKIVAQDNNVSTIFIGQNVPYNSSVTQITGGGASNSQTSNIEYRDIGFNLTITPVLGNNDIVSLDISIDITSQLQTTASNTTFNISGIATTRTTMATKVRVPSDNFLVLSGMINDTKTHFKSQVPCLGGLPIIGAAFSENDRLAQKDNVILFVRPHIIDTYEDYKALTEHQQVLYKDQAVLPILKEEFDSGIDMVKTPENEK